MKRLISLFVLLTGLLFCSQLAPVQAQETLECGEMTALNLHRGDIARVSNTDDRPNRLRERPTISARVIDSIPVGDLFEIEGGPRCADDIIWWRVSYQNQTGWTAQGVAGTNYIELVSAAATATPRPTQTATPRVTPQPTPTPQPNATSSPTADNCSLAPDRQLEVRSWARVTYVDSRPSNLRAEPGLDSSIVTTINPGERVWVVNGPECVDGYRWWRVRYDGQLGWVGDGVRNPDGTYQYYLVPDRARS
ncbi:SH3 domain-containing protein [Patescibacteria group bacterium]|nr:SH3 domain-containing protein [Patescibacteria group bacterium]